MVWYCAGELHCCRRRDDDIDPDPHILMSVQQTDASRAPTAVTLAPHLASARPACRSCGAPLQAVFADLGPMPISNAFVRPEQAAAGERFYPLRVCVCEHCWLVQTENYVAPETHFHGDYAYFSGYSETWLAHCRALAAHAVERFGLNSESRVVEVASNDGHLLQYFVERGISCLGVDPAANCAKVAWEHRRVRTEVAFFGTRTAARLFEQSGAADLIVANNVLAHVPDINDFVAGFKILLKPEGTALFEFPHVLELIRNSQFDTIYHEHYSYPSLIALKPLFARHGLDIVDVERVRTHGGSLRLYVCHAGTVGARARPVGEIEVEEVSAGLSTTKAYVAFDARVRALKRSLLTLLIELTNADKKIAGYGAPAKGNTLLNFCGIGADFLPFTVDRSTHKQGLLLPGTHIPIRPPDEIFAFKPDFVLILPWNLREEIMAQLAGIRAWGGKFIVPVPWPAVLD